MVSVSVPRLVWCWGWDLNPQTRRVLASKTSVYTVPPPQQSQPNVISRHWPQKALWQGQQCSLPEPPLRNASTNGVCYNRHYGAQKARLSIICDRRAQAHRLDWSAGRKAAPTARQKHQLLYPNCYAPAVQGCPQPSQEGHHAKAKVWHPAQMCQVREAC